MERGKAVRVFAPATVANVACGYDILGFAVEAPGDEVEMERIARPEVILESITGDQGLLPCDPERNTATIVVSHFLRAIGAKEGVRVRLHKQMPLGSGLGSSAASAVGAIHAANELFGRPLTQRELLPFALEGERAACGSGHADNAAPSLLGGFVLVRSYEPLDVIRIPTPPELYCTLVHPHIEIQTKDARSLLRRQIYLRDAVTQWGNVGGLVAGMYSSDYELIGRSIQDVIIEPTRALLIPGYDAIKEAALQAGALGCSISGSGPSIFTLAKGEATARAAAEAMQRTFWELGIDNEVYVSRINTMGPKLLEAVPG